MSGPVVFIVGSPSTNSRSSLAADAVAKALRAGGVETRFYSLRDFVADDVLFGRFEAPSITSFVASVKEAPALVLATPVYKATYTGSLKAIVDLVPPDALVGRPALGIASAKLPDHAKSAVRAFGELFAFFKAHTLHGVPVRDDEFDGAGESLRVGRLAGERLDLAAQALIAAIRSAAAGEAPSR
jgi:FMN reductase